MYQLNILSFSTSEQIENILGRKRQTLVVTHFAQLILDMNRAMTREKVKLQRAPWVSGQMWVKMPRRAYRLWLYILEQRGQQLLGEKKNCDEFFFVLVTELLSFSSHKKLQRKLIFSYQKLLHLDLWSGQALLGKLCELFLPEKEELQMDSAYINACWQCICNFRQLRDNKLSALSVPAE